MRQGRTLIIFLSVVAGVLVATLDVVVAFHFMPPGERPPAARNSPEDQRVIFEACVTFYGVVYLVGRLLYSLLGRLEDAAELHSWSRVHMQLLHLIGGLWLVISGWTALHRSGALRPSLLVGMVLIASAVRDAWANPRAVGWTVSLDFLTEAFVFPIGVNPLGAMEIMFALLPVMAFPGESRRAVGLTLNLLCSCTVVVGDILLRRRNRQSRSLRSLLSPYAGETIFLVPGWASVSAFWSSIILLGIMNQSHAPRMLHSYLKQ